MLYDNPIRAAENSRQGKAISDRRFSVIVGNKKVQAQVIWSKGDYHLTYAGLMNTEIRFSNVRDFVDKVKKWRPM